MPARTQATRQQCPQPAVAPDSWSGWIDVAVGIGNAVVAYELALAAALSPVVATRSGPARSRLVLVHSGDAPGAPAQPRQRPALHAVPCRHEGKA